MVILRFNDLKITLSAEMFSLSFKSFAAFSLPAKACMERPLFDICSIVNGTFAQSWKKEFFFPCPIVFLLARDTRATSQTTQLEPQPKRCHYIIVNKISNKPDDTSCL
jgi:hypothetical protein